MECRKENIVEIQPEKNEAFVSASDERDDSSAATADTASFTRHIGETNASINLSIAEYDMGSNQKHTKKPIDVEDFVRSTSTAASTDSTSAEGLSTISV